MFYRRCNRTDHRTRILSVPTKQCPLPTSHAHPPTPSPPRTTPHCSALEVIKTAKDALHDGKPIAAEECITAMAALRSACAGGPKTELDADPTVADESTPAPARAGPGVTTNKSIIAMAKGPDSLAAFLPFVALAPAALDTLCAVCEDSVENRDSFPSIAIAVLAKLLDASMADDSPPPSSS